MSDAPLPVTPEWVIKRDGQVVPFEADKISRSIFAATENHSRSDAFLARELTDSEVHFLAADTEGTHPRGEDRRVGEGMAPRAGRRDQVRVHVDEDRARDMAGVIGDPTVTGTPEIPAHVHDTQVRIEGTRRELACRYETHRASIAGDREQEARQQRPTPRASLASCYPSRGAGPRHSTFEASAPRPVPA